MPLLDGRNEPLRGVDLVLHELNGLLVLLLHQPVRTHHFADHVHIAAVDAHFGNVVGIQREVEPPVLVVENEIRNDIGRGVRAALDVEVAGLGRQMPDLGDRIAEIVLGNLQPRHQFLVVLLDELVEIVGQNLLGQPPRTGVDRHLRHLQQQAFAQVARADARRLQFVNDSEQALQLSGRRFEAHREGDVIGHGLQVAAQVAVLVDAADQVDRQPHVALRQIAVAQLLDEVFLQRPPLGQIDGTLLVVLRKVVDAALVRRRVVLPEVFVDGNLLGRLLLVLGRTLLLFQHDIVFDLLFDTLFELHGGQFQQLDHLDLLRRELLLKRKYLFLINSHIGSKLRITAFRIWSLHLSGSFEFSKVVQGRFSQEADGNCRFRASCRRTRTGGTRGPPVRVLQGKCGICFSRRFLKVGVLRSTGERLHVTDVGHARHEKQQPVEAQAEARMRSRSPAAGIEIPP